MLSNTARQCGLQFIGLQLGYGEDAAEHAGKDPHLRAAPRGGLENGKMGRRDAVNPVFKLLVRIYRFEGALFLPEAFLDRFQTANQGPIQVIILFKRRIHEVELDSLGRARHGDMVVGLPFATINDVDQIRGMLAKVIAHKVALRFGKIEIGLLVIGHIEEQNAAKNRGLAMTIDTKDLDMTTYWQGKVIEPGRINQDHSIKFGHWLSPFSLRSFPEFRSGRQNQTSSLLPKAPGPPDGRDRTRRNNPAAPWTAASSATAPRWWRPH